jgi:hypothetical protein
MMLPARLSSLRPDRRQTLAAVAAGLLALAVAAAPVSASGSDQPAGKNCVSAEEASVHAAGDSGGEDEGAPPKFSPAFYKRVFTLDVSLDGMDGRELPISIEEVCDIPKALAKEARQLAGADGVALLLPSTSVWQDGTRLSGKAADTAVEGADTATLRVRLAARPSWRQDEDGGPVATFRARRIEVTD